MNWKFFFTLITLVAFTTRKWFFNIFFKPDEIDNFIWLQILFGLISLLSLFVIFIKFRARKVSLFLVIVMFLIYFLRIEDRLEFKTKRLFCAGIKEIRGSECNALGVKQISSESLVFKYISVDYPYKVKELNFNYRVFLHIPSNQFDLYINKNTSEIKSITKVAKDWYLVIQLNNDKAF